MLRVFDLISQVAPSRSTVLIQGESGTGKEIIAKAIHANSQRKDKPFVPINTGAMPSELLESTLFGHVKGAFTSAVASKKGLFEVANGGTLFLDEIATMGMDTQAKILRVLQDKRFMHLGGIQEIQVDVRILAATNIDLRQAVHDGRFREDLFYRLNVITIDLPPLRERREDIPLLVQHFLDYYANENGFSSRRLSSDAMAALLDYNWPGNVRELENCIERGVVLSSGEVINTELLPPHVKSASTTVNETATNNVNSQDNDDASIPTVPSIVNPTRLLYVDDYRDSRTRFVEAINDQVFLERLRYHAGINATQQLRVEAVSPSDLPRDRNELKKYLGDVAFLVLDQNFDKARDPWRNGQILYCYVVDVFPEIFSRAIFLTKHGEEREILVYREELMRELAKDPELRGRSDRLSNLIPYVMHTAPPQPPLPLKEHDFWDSFRQALLRCANRYRVETQLETIKRSSISRLDRLAEALANELHIVAMQSVETAPFFGRLEERHLTDISRNVPSMRSLNRGKFRIDRKHYAILRSETLEHLQMAVTYAAEQLRADMVPVKALYWDDSTVAIRRWCEQNELDGAISNLTNAHLLDLLKAAEQQLICRRVYWTMWGEQNTPMHSKPMKFYDEVAKWRKDRTRERGLSRN